MRQWTFKIVLNEGNDEFWEDKTQSTNEAVTEELRQLLDDSLLYVDEIKLIKFEEVFE